MLQNHSSEFKGFMDNIFDSVMISGKIIKKNFFSEEALDTYVGILTRSKEEKDHEKLVFFIENYEYSLDDCLDLCKEYNLRETWAYLEEKMENYLKALQLRYEV